VADGVREPELFPWKQRARSGNVCEIMLDKSPANIRERREKFHFQFWQLRTPLTNYAIEGVYPYALDNGCFSGRLSASWPRLLREAEDVPPRIRLLP
jgi:hypothetical protein